jgi:cytoskeletal protein CcmA (bactofilin family)
MYGKVNGRIVTASLSASFFFAMAVLALAVFAPAAQAEERVCRGTIGATTVDNLRVPQGATCTLNGTRVEGTVKVERNATLTASGIRVKGNVQSEGFKNITLRQNSVVVGSVQLENGLRGGSGRVLNSKVNGDLQFFSNEARMVARGNTILANFQANQNTGGLVIENNRIAENLQCQSNNPPPTGGNNTAGDKEGQCARL